jgi:GT2 family glycosyltransferase
MQLCDRPQISVLMPMRNAEAFVRSAVRSVLSQKGVNLELIVVDDGSTDGSAAAVGGIGDPRVRVIDGPRRGIAAALNTALAAARGAVVARCDADDLYPPGRLREQLDWLDRHPDFAAVCGTFTTISRRGLLVAELHCGRRAQEITAELASGTVRTHFATFATRTQVLRRLGGCREFFVTGEDVDLMLRLGEAARVGYEPIPRYYYRLHDASITHTRDQVLQAFYDATARRFQTQRLSGRPDDLERGHPPAPPAPTPSADSAAALQIRALLMGTAWANHEHGHKLPALAAGLRLVMLQPMRLRMWKNLLALLLKRAGTRVDDTGDTCGIDGPAAGAVRPPAADRQQDGAAAGNGDVDGGGDGERSSSRPPRTTASLPAPSARPTPSSNKLTPLAPPGTSATR